MKKTKIRTRLRFFRMWQKTGRKPFQKTVSALPIATCSSCGASIHTPYCPQCGQAYSARNGKSFFKGAFDSIPFLNDDGKRTFTHLMLRPGYMIRDYLNGLNSRYLAPMTALIVFYAFFALVSSVISPDLTKENPGSTAIKNALAEEGLDSLSFDTKWTSMLSAAQNIYIFTNLDLFPECVDTQAKASLAAMEGNLRDQGLFSFLGQFIILTLALWIIFGRNRAHKLSFSASATVAAYILCQFCFFMMIALILTMGGQSQAGGIDNDDPHRLGPLTIAEHKLETGRALYDAGRPAVYAAHRAGHIDRVRNPGAGHQIGNQPLRRARQAHSSLLRRPSRMKPFCAAAASISATSDS